MSPLEGPKYMSMDPLPDSTYESETSGSSVNNNDPEDEPESVDFMPIAIVGMAFRFPQGAEDSESFWQMLVDKRNAATEFPKERFNVDAFWHHDSKRDGVMNTRRAHLLEGDPRAFDSGFFSMNPQEVGAMDPQQRGLLETTYHALENAGLPLDKVAGTRTAVHVGCFTNDWNSMLLKDAQQIPKYTVVGTAGSILANRLSWFYDFRGESTYIDTACSSGLVAFSQACQTLAAGNAEMAVVSASNLVLTPEFNIALSNLNMLSPSGLCQSFDAKGDGYGRGEGLCTLILKPAARAIADGDPIRAIVRAVGMNQDGHTSGGITQPSKDMQVQLIQETYQKAGLSMRHTRFFEAHGTGTAVGDPIEARAIGGAFFKHRTTEDPLYVGAVKSNVGHLEGTSALASVVKSVLILEKGIIPPNTNFDTLNPHIDADFLKIKFPTECIPFPNTAKRRISVNSFGFGGSNAHVVLESADDYLRDTAQTTPFGLNGGISAVADRAICTPGVKHVAAGGDISTLPQKLLESLESAELETPINQNSDTNLNKSETETLPPRLLVLSAADEDGIKRQAIELSQYLKTHVPQSQPQLLEDVTYTLNTRRTQLAWRSYAIVDSASAPAVLEEALSKPNRRATTGAPVNIGFVFTGQGAQWARMSHELLEWPVFKDSILESQRILGDLGCTWTLIDELEKSADDSQINDPQFSQTITTAIQIALVDLAFYLDIEITVALGHSSGEIAAAYCAGFLCHDSAIKVSYFRGKLASRLASSDGPKHGMVSIGLPSDAVHLELSRIQEEDPLNFDSTQVTISCINSPSNVTVSGPDAMLNVLVDNLSSKGVFARRLKVDVGYHSAQMNAVSSEYLDVLGDLKPGSTPGRVRMVSTVTPGLISLATVCSNEYWVQNMVSPVRFVEAMEICCKNSSEDGVIKKIDRSHLNEIITHGWLEIGPHAALKGPLREIFQATKRGDGLLYSSFLVRNKPANRTFLDAIGQLYCRNFNMNLHSLVNIDTIAPRTPRTLSDLPQYPFNHSVIHFDEPTRSRLFRTRQYGNHDLLGSPAMDWNPLDAKWLFTIKKGELPWISEHKVHGRWLYPASGMLVMAIEALKQLLGGQAVLGFEFQNVYFLAPIVLNESPEGIETQLSMVPVSNQGAKDVEYKFRIYVRRPDDSWNEVCHGSIQADGGRSAQTVDFQAEDKHRTRIAQETYERILCTCPSFLDTEELYSRITKNTKLVYGPLFQSLSNIGYDLDGNAHATVLPYENRSHKDFENVTVHPSTLDGIFQLSLPALTGGIDKPTTTLVPARLTRMWISNAGSGHGDVESEVGYSIAKSLSSRTALFSTTVFSKPDMEVRVVIEELEVTEAGEESAPEAEEPSGLICQELEWNVDLGLLDDSQVLEHCATYRKSIEEPKQFYSDLTMTLLRFAAQSFAKLGAENRTPVQSLERYSNWLQARVDEYLALNPTEEARQALYDSLQLQELGDRLSTENKRGLLNVHVGKNITGLLLGEVDPMELILGDEQLLAEFYEELNSTGKALDMAHAYLDALVHKNPDLKFLEIGAGTGATTCSILDTIASQRGLRFSQYDFTDVSPAFLAKARDRFASTPRVNYRVLNIESDLDAQDFGNDQYDVIIAANVLHATESLSTTLSNVQQLLKPGGKLVLLEMTTPKKIHTAFVFGLLQGWWCGTEEFRHDGAVIPEEQWNLLLRQHGFSGTDQVFRDWDTEECHGWSIMVSTAVNPISSGNAISSDSTPLLKTTFVVDKTSDLQNSTAATMCEDLSQQNRTVDIMSFDDLLSVPDDEYKERDFVILTGLEKAVLNDIQPTDFEVLKKIMTFPRSTLFVNNIGTGSNDAPYWAMFDGLTRCLRNENSMVTFSTLSLEKDTCASVGRIISHLTKVFSLMCEGMENGSLEQEWLESQGKLCVNRLLSASSANEHISTRTMDKIRMREFGAGFPLKLGIRTPGLLDTMEWVQDESAYVTLGPDEVEIRIQAIGVNFKECLTLLGRVNSNNLGSECSGYVQRVGSDVRGLNIGDRVALGSGETYRTLVRAFESQVVKIPDAMTFVEAAAIPTAFCTAYISLNSVARLQEGESVLIHAAAGGTGQAAIQIAQYLKAEIFATVSTDQKKKLLMEQYGIQEDHIFYSRDSSFADGIKRVTKGRGVDVVLNSLSGKLLVASWEIIAEFGRFVEIGRKDIDSRGSLPMHPFIKNAIFAGVDLTTIVGRPKGNQAMQWIYQKFAEGALRPIHPLQAFRVDDIETPFRLIQSGKSSGKMIIEISDEAIVPVREGPDSDYRFSEDATYVIAGGLGGIGRQLARWIAHRGAKHILVLSRSGIDGNAKRSEMVAQLKEQGINVVNAVCDITDLESLKRAIDMHLEGMPPVRGCFQAAMALADRPFSIMEHSEWTTAIRPKVQGSWNLHTALPQGLDFFVMLSSSVGTFGNAGQSNYAAGNTFQDALARYRVARGEKAIAIDLGMILGEGFVAENKVIQDSLLRLDLLRPLSQRELFALFDYYCDPSLSYDRVSASQIITGIEPPAAIRRKGGEVPAALQTSLFRCMHQIDVAGGIVENNADSTQDISTAFKEASSLEEAVDLVAEALKNKVCKMLGLDSDERTPQDRMDLFGVDSLVALELRNWLAKELRTDVAIYEILGDTKLIDIAMTVARKSQLQPVAWR